MSLPKIAAHETSGWPPARSCWRRRRTFTRERDALQRRAARAADGRGREGLRVRGPDGRGRARRPVRGPPAADHLPLHVRPGVGRRLPELHRGHQRALAGFLEHLHAATRRTRWCRGAPLEKLERWKAKQGWDSSRGTRRTGRTSTTTSGSRSTSRWRPLEYNFRTKAEFEALGSDFFAADQPFEMPGRSCFLEVDGRVFHTYSQYARGLESTGGSYYFLDLTALGRQEDWEEPKGRSESACAAVPNFASSHRQSARVGCFGTRSDPPRSPRREAYPERRSGTART